MKRPPNYQWRRRTFEFKGGFDNKWQCRRRGVVGLRDVMKGFVFGTVSAFCLFPAPAVADPSFECSVTTSSQVETADCLAAVEKTVDMTLAAALEFALRSARELDEVVSRNLGVPALEQSQKSWAAYRDDQCEFVGTTFGGGSGTGIAIRSCRIELGRARIRELFDTLQ